MIERVVHVLLLEDSVTDARLIMRALGRERTDVAVTRVDDERGLRAALAARAWDVVLSDWSIPGFTALAALAVVRAHSADLPFIIVSGTVGEELAVEALRAGANDYVLKDKLARLVPAIEREIREAALREEHRKTEARFRALIEKSAEAVLLTDTDGAIAYASPASTAIFGGSTGGLLGRSLGGFIHAEDRAFAADTLERLREDRSIAVPVECRVVRDDGSARWVALTGTNLLDDPTVRAMVVNLRDITERRRAAEALHASEARFARLAESGIIGIVTVDDAGTLRDANDTWLAMVGYSRADLAAGTLQWRLLVAPTDEECDAPGPDGVGGRLGSARPWETVAIHKSGARIPILIGLAPLAPPLRIAFSVDLTEKKRAEVSLRAIEEQLRQAQKMEAVGRLAGGVAHDFNNVLSIILSYAEMVLEELADDDPKRESVNEICLAGWRAAELTRQLLMFSRRQMLELRTLDLNAVIANMEKMLRRVLGEDVELVTVRAESLGLIKADPSSVEQVIMNLVVNARDAMPVGGRLTLETDNVGPGETLTLHHPTLPPGAYVKLVVRDTGIGMDEATRARVFEPFFTTKPKDQGTGLGLSTVFGIVQQSGGSVWVESAPGQGSVFEICLPCVEGRVEPNRPRDALREHGHETILLVEDEEQVRGVVRQILRRHGYHVLEATDGAAALDVFERARQPVDLVLTDVVMPNMSGPELARALTARAPTVPVIFMSGYTDDNIVRHGILHSDIAFLQKPVTPDGLTRKIREVLDAARAAR